MSPKDNAVKTIVIALLPVALLLAGLLPCHGQSPNANPTSPSQGSGDPQAIRETLQRYLKADAPHNSQAFLDLWRQGDRVLPYVMEAALAENGKNSHLYPHLGYVLRHLNEETRRKAAPQLLEVLTAQDTSLELADGILILIGNLGEPGLVIEPELIDFHKRRPDLRLTAEYALIQIGSSQCGRIYAERLAKEPSTHLLGGVAARGPLARGAGLEVERLLNHSDWDMRLAAAKTLGAIGYSDAVPALIDLLDEPTDFRLNRAAAESLGRLGAHSAVEALKETAASHWYPVVRDTAQEALEHIVSGKPYEPKTQNHRFILNRDPFRNRNLPPKDVDQLRREIELSPVKRPDFVEEPLEAKMYKATSPAKMPELTYGSEVIGIGGEDEEKQRRARERGDIVTVRDDGSVEYRRSIKQTPDVALRVANGWLAGSSRGEWGGELVFVADDGQQTKILTDNVDDLFKLGERYIAVTGLAHFFSSRGLVYEVKSTDGGQWVCEPWRALPGAPRVCGKLASGDVFIGTYGGGDLVLAPDGTFTMASN